MGNRVRPVRQLLGDWFRAGLAADSRIRAPALYEGDGQTEKKVRR
jgi:hypothetical protein